jgi:hypothetical protein
LPPHDQRRRPFDIHTRPLNATAGVPNIHPLEEARNRLAYALNRLERLEADPRADRWAIHRASKSVAYWSRAVRLAMKEPQQAVLPWR